eukprot:CAMPEP_0185276264 /NCGR_PEP_ID=MMETSP1359-20130426/55808_1 /TAXON_ID=552665 /ORGANISM="Bigelowiella longifila, Strain CCMP242" /LENGTH=156 /DNA_ID=CAMNT_0027869873 /DNA_START=188 /DNA_END=658 /DNA_ORIENTATION=-
MNSLLLYGAKCGLNVSRRSGVAVFSGGIILCVFALLGAAYILVLNACFLFPYLIGVVVSEQSSAQQSSAQKSHDCGGKSCSDSGKDKNDDGGHSRVGNQSDNERPKDYRDSRSFVDVTNHEENQVGGRQDEQEHASSQHDVVMEGLGADGKSWRLP